MKCDELEEWYAGQFSPSARVYGASEVDAAIAELKQKLENVQASMYADVVDANMENRRLKREFRIARAKRAIEKNRLKEEKAQLKDKLEQEQLLRSHWNEDDYAMVNELERLSNETEKLKQKLENVQASMYADVVDANMENRRLKRALWLERARNADSMYRIFYFVPSSYLGEPLNIFGYSNEERGRKMMLTADKWKKIWLKVLRKCLKKAEEYK